MRGFESYFSAYILNAELEEAPLLYNHSCIAVL